MDSLTQAALGALCGELILRKPLGNKAILWGLFFGTLPDLDIILAPFITNMEWLRLHRGLSHSILLMLLASPLLGILLTKIHPAITRTRAITFVLLTWATHVLIDCFNSYGTQIYEPFSNHRVALNNIAIIDLFFTLPMLIGLIACLFIKRTSKKRITLGYTIATWLTLYTTASFTIKSIVTKKFQQALTTQNINHDTLVASPTLSNIFLWRMLATDPENFHIAYYSIFDNPDSPIKIETIPKTQNIAPEFKNAEPFNTIQWFTQNQYKAYQLPNQPNTLYLTDMRFTEMHTQNDQGKYLKLPPFLWKLTKTPQGIEIQKSPTRSQANPKKSLHFLYQRIKGNKQNHQQGTYPWQTSNQ